MVTSTKRRYIANQLQLHSQRVCLPKILKIPIQEMLESGGACLDTNIRPPIPKKREE
jgi:hypothetical protein